MRPPADTTRSVVELEHRGWHALSSGADAAAAFYEDVLADRVLLLLPGGLVIDDRAEVIAAMRGAPWDDYALSDERVLELTATSATVAYRARARRGETEYDALFSSTYVLDAGSWKLAFHQQTPIGAHEDAARERAGGIMNSQPDKIAAVPEGYGTVTPWIIARDSARLLDFISAAFDGREIARVPNEDGSIGHAEIRIGDSVVMMFDRRADWPDLPAFLRLYVDDGDAVFARATGAGAEPVTEMTELAWGDRVGRVRDPQGNVWWIQERVAEFAPDEIAQRMAEPRFVDAMRYVQQADLVPAVR